MYLVVPPGGCFPETRRIELGPGALTIGRAQACEIRVDVPGVDEEHAKISEVALIALGSDCAIGDVPLDPGSRRLLMPGDEIQIGSVVVALEGDDPSLVPPAPDETERMFNPLLQVPRVRVVEGTTFGDELLLKEEGREYLVGRGPKCDLVLDDREVSREHVKLVRRGYTIHIQDLSSTRGSWLGRAAVYTGSTIEWTRPRMLRVGATVLSLDLPEAIRKAAPAAQASAPHSPMARSRPGPLDPTPTPPVSRGSNTLTPAPSQPPPNSPAGMAVGAAHEAMRHLTHTAPTAGAPAFAAPASHPSPAAGAPRKAWKKSGPTIGKASGLLLLALAGLVILGGLFVVFSLLE